MIRQGEVYWLDLVGSLGSGPGYRHPHVVVQNDLFNRSRIHTTVVCTLTSNLNRAASPGNIRLEAGEANLPKRCVVNVSQLYTVDKDELVERIGSLDPVRLREILAGIDLVLKPRDVDE